MSAPDDLTEKLRTLVRIPTVSYDDPTAVDTEAFDLFVATLAELFPLLHEHLALTRVERHGLLFHWAGASAERPVVLMAHLDVVPVDESAPWQHPAFDAVVARRRRLGPRHARRQGLAGRRSARPSSGCWPTASSPPQDVWLSFGARRGGLRPVRAGRGRGAPRARRRAVVRARRGRRDRARGVPRRRPRRWASSASPRRAPPTSSCAPRAAAGTPRRRRGWTHRPARAGRPAAGEQPVPRARARADAGDVAPGRAARPGRRCARCSPTPTGRSRCSPARWSRPARSPPP